MFNIFLNEILKISSNTKDSNFKEQTNLVSKFVDSLDDENIKSIVKEIGIIPECIKASSSAEKLFSKSSDIILARAFIMLGLKSKALDGRGDSADVLAESIFHKYSLVADAKCFRLSRTTKNQKDFKVAALSNWRGGENEYAVLVSPYFQYPKEESQIYKAALNENVCLIAWEHISLLLENNIKETENISLESIWESSKMIARDSKIASAKNCFLPKVNKIVSKKLGFSEEQFASSLNRCKLSIIARGSTEITYCENKIESINNLTKEEAINELIKETKLEEKINVINSFISSLDTELEENKNGQS